MLFTAAHLHQAFKQAANRDCTSLTFEGLGAAGANAQRNGHPDQQPGTKTGHARKFEEVFGKDPQVLHDAIR